MMADSGPVVGGAREDVELRLAFRGRIRRTRPFVHRERLAPHRPRDLLQARARRVVLPGEAPRLHLHVRVRAGLHRPDEAVEVAAVERRHLETLRLLVLDAIDAAEAVVAIGTHGGVGGPVLRPARVVVDHRLVVEIDDVERPVGPDTRLDGPEPEIAAADELRLFAPLLLARRVAHAIRPHELVMHQVDGRLGREVAVAPPIGPGAPVVDGAAGRRRELSDQIDLGVSLFLPRRRRIGLLPGDHALVGGRVRHAALGQHVLRQHGVEEHRAARRLGPEDLAVPRDVEAPRVAAAAAVPARTHRRPA